MSDDKPHSAPHIKVCSRCQSARPLTEFNFRNRGAGIRHSYCRDCGKALTHNHYEQDKRQYIDRVLRSHAKRREYLRAVKSRPCADCGVQYPYYVMDFDHRAGEEKIFEMNRVNYGRCAPSNERLRSAMSSVPTVTESARINV